MTTRSITAANETLKQDPQKGSVVPAKTLHNWNNRVLYTIPNQARRETKKSANKYEAYREYLLGLLQNPSLNSFTETEKTKLVKKCVSIVPEVFFDLDKVKGYENVKNKLTVQLTAYETLKKMGNKEDAELLLSDIGAEQSKKVLAKAKANVTRKANKKASKKAEAKADGETL